LFPLSYHITFLPMYWILGLLVLLLVWIAFAYNQFVQLRNNRSQSFSDVDVQMKLRYDLIPNLVEVVKGYATHEKGTFEKIAELRSAAMRAGTLAERATAEIALSGALSGIFALAENYPDLKANQNFLSLQQELSDIENKIAAARRFFNNTTKEYNTSIQSFPNLLFAGIFGFHHEEFFDLGDDRSQAEQPVSIKL